MEMPRAKLSGIGVVPSVPAYCTTWTLEWRHCLHEIIYLWTHFSIKELRFH